MVKNKEWSEDELKASVKTYIEMLSKEQSEISFIKKDYYVKLSNEFGRTQKAFEYRMQNISYVYSILGRQHVKGLLPLKNVGSNVINKIESILSELENRPFNKKIKKSLAKKDALFTINQILKKDTWDEADNDDIKKYQTIAKKIRSGQPKFRRNLLKLYDEKCVITNCPVKGVLEAAHILNHSISGINDSSNGLLLRSDLHNLFDSNKIKINPKTYKIEVNESLKNTSYWQFNNNKIRPGINGEYPSKEYLTKKYNS